MGTFLLFAGVNGLITGLFVLFLSFLVNLYGKNISGAVMVKMLLATTATTFLVTFLFFYNFIYAITGLIGGLFPFLACAAIGSLLGAGLVGVYAKKSDFTGYGAIPLVLVVITYIVVFTGYNLSFVFADTAHQLASIAHITRHSQNDNIPQTDEKHLVIVTQGIAYAEGQSSIAADGHNYGSRYQTSEDEYTLQSIRGHLYYIAPLDYNNLFIQLNGYETPGYVRVDAEDPSASAVLIDNKPLHYTTQAQFGTNLDRHIYESGYTNCNLIDPTLEVDDSDTPWYTVSCATTKTGVDGNLIQSVLLVNSDTGEIQKYSLDTVPVWVDRVYDESTVHDYMDWWGKYLTQPWFNPGGSGQSTPANNTLQILYSKASESPVYVVPMTSSNSNDNSSNGIALCQTRSNQCDFYPLYGYGIDSAVDAAFNGAVLPGNANVRPSHSTPQLVNLYGCLSWVTTYETDASIGKTFYGVGIVDATRGHLTASNAIVRQNLADALSAYQSYVVSNPAGGTRATAQSATKTFTAPILAVQSYVQNGKTIYAFLFKGDTHVYYADTVVSRFLPFMQAGDIVTVTYNNTNLTTLNIKTIFDQRLTALTGA